MSTTQMAANHEMNADQVPPAIVRPARSNRRGHVMKCIVATLTTAALTVSMSSVAGASGSVSPNAFSCSAGGVVSVNGPRIWTNYNTPEKVSYRLFLHRYQNSRWEVVAITNWATGTVNNQGFAVTGYRDNVTGLTLTTMRRFTGASAGFYTVTYAVQWNDGAKASGWVPSWNNPSLGYCRFS